MREVVPRLEEGVTLALDFGASTPAGRSHTEHICNASLLARSDSAGSGIISLGQQQRDANEGNECHNDHYP